MQETYNFESSSISSFFCCAVPGFAILSCNTMSTFSSGLLRIQRFAADQRINTSRDEVSLCTFMIEAQKLQSK